MGIFRTKPTVGLTDNPGDAAPGRHSWYGDAYIVPVETPRVALAAEGSYFTGVNATLATAIAGHVAPALADNDPLPTKSLLHLYNAGQRWIAFDYLKLTEIVVNASSTSTDFTVYVDNLGSSGRTSGGTAITANNVRSDNPFTTGATVYFGAVVTAAAAAAKKIAQWTVRPVIAVAEDQYTFKFGADPMLNSSVTHIGTAVANLLVNMPPVIISPGGNMYFCFSGPSGATTAATHEFEFGFWER